MPFNLEEQHSTDVFQNQQTIPISNFETFSIKTESTTLTINMTDTGQNQDILLFPSSKKFREFAGYLPTYLWRLIDTLTPGPIQFLLPKYTDQIVTGKISLYIPETGQLKNFVDLEGWPLKASFTNDIISMPKQIDNAGLISGADHYSQEILPTLVDCTEPNTVSILRPGLISKSDIQLLLPRNVRLEKNYFQGQKLPFLDILTLNQKPTEDQKIMVMGTKEKLKKEYNLWFLNHFETIQRGNHTLLNLGSQTSLENLVRHLGEKLQEAKALNFDKVYFLNQVWPQNQWGEILRFIFNNLSKSGLSEFESEGDYLQTPTNLVLELN